MNYIAEAINHDLLKNWKHIVVLLDGHPMGLAEIKLQHLRRHRIGRDRTRTRCRRIARSSFWWGAYDDVAEERRRRRASLRLSWMRRWAWSRTTLWAATSGALTGQTFIVTRGERAVPWRWETAGEMEERAAGGGCLDEDERQLVGGDNCSQASGGPWRPTRPVAQLLGVTHNEMLSARPQAARYLYMGRPQHACVDLAWLGSGNSLQRWRGILSSVGLWEVTGFCGQGGLGTN